MFESITTFLDSSKEELERKLTILSFTNDNFIDSDEVLNLKQSFKENLL